MLLSVQWLRQFVKLPAHNDAGRLAHDLTMHTAEAEGVTNLATTLAKVVTGRILSIKQHPDADGLHVAQIQTGPKEVRTIVFGSRFPAKEGMVVPVALPGAYMPGINVTIEKRMLRGIESEGMICADDELNLPFSRTGLMIFPDDMPVGMPLAEALELNDQVIEFSNTALTNRPDLFSVVGFAREVAALTNTKLQPLKISAPKSNKDVIPVRIKVAEKKLCTRYMAVRITGINNEESPIFVKSRLIAAGMRPINLIVDLTNYVMLEQGQPLHAFDGAKMSGAITIRRAKAGEVLRTLDDKERTLDPEMLVIADEREAKAIAGVMGGASSEVGDTTTEVILESACFSASFIRKTSQRLGLRSEASLRFEKELHPALAEIGLARFVQLLQKIQPAIRVGKIGAVGETRFSRTLKLPWATINNRIGLTVKPAWARTVLTQLGFVVKQSKTDLIVSVPWFRSHDIVIAEDLIEEVVRMYGYDRVPMVRDSVQTDLPDANHFSDFVTQAKQALVGAGVDEVMSLAFVSPATIQKLGLLLDDHLRIKKPLSEDLAYLRSTIVSGLIEKVVKNLRQEEAVRLFEIERIFSTRPSTQHAGGKGALLLPEQDFFLGIAVAAAGDGRAVFAAKGVIDTVLRGLRYTPTFRNVTPHHPYMHPTRCAEILIGNKTVGWLFELHPQVARQYGARERLGMVELNFSLLEQLQPELVAYSPLAKFPAVQRDLAIVISESVTAAQIEASAKEGHALVTAVTIFDIFRDATIGEGKKSVALRLTYADPNKTLTSAEIDAAHAAVLKRLAGDVKAEART